MGEDSGQLERKQDPNDFDSGFSQTSFQLHRIEPGDMQNKNPRNGTHAKYLDLFSCYVLQRNFSDEGYAKIKISQVENKQFNKSIFWNNDTSL